MSKAKMLIRAGDCIMSVHRQTNEDAAARANARGPNLFKQLGLGLAVQRRRLPCLPMTQTTRADSGDAGPRGQAVFGDSGVFAAFSMHETLGFLSMEPALSKAKFPIPAGDEIIMSARRQTNENATARPNARGPKLFKQLVLGLAVHRRRLPCLAMPRATQAENSDAEPQGLGDSGVSAAFSVHETLVDHLEARTHEHGTSAVPHSGLRLHHVHAPTRQRLLASAITRPRVNPMQAT